jgi:copper chaperone CopZ
MHKTLASAVLFIMVIPGGLGSAYGADQSVTLMLGGKFCDAYLGDVRDALVKVAGVKTVDLKSMKGHAVVTVDGSKVKPDQLAQVVNGVKGDGWHCTGQVMN